MAVPKKKTSKSRRDKRRARRRIHAPRVNLCPNCGFADAPAPRLPDVQAGIAAARSSRSAPPPRSRRGQGRGRRSRRRLRARTGVRHRRGRRELQFPRARSCWAPPGPRDAGASAGRGPPRRSRSTRSRPRRCGASPTRRSYPIGPRRRRGRRRRGRLRREHGRDARRVPARAPRLPGVLQQAIAVPIPTERGPSVLLDSGANADARPEHLFQFAHMGAVFAEEILGIERARGSPALDRRGAQEGEPASPSRPTSCSRGARLRFAGNAESHDLLAGAADVVVCGRLHRQRVAEAARRHDPHGARRPAAARSRRRVTARARRTAHPGRPRGVCAGAPRPGHLRGRLPARTARPGGDRARELEWQRSRSRTRSGSRPVESSTTWSPGGGRCAKGFRRPW